METDRLAQLIEEKRVILTRLQQLSRRQSEMIHHGDINRLMSLLAAKQASIGLLKGVEKELDPFRDQEPESRRWRSAEVRQQVREVARENELMLQEIMRVEEECESHLRRRRDEAANRLQGVHDKARARSAYLDGGGPRNSQLDLSSES